MTGDIGKATGNGISNTSPWKAHEGMELTNGIVSLTVLTHGGHFAEFRFTDQDSVSMPNVLWVAPWVLDLQGTRSPQHLSETGGLTGHALCLDHFGEPSDAEAATGLTLHGEAATKSWKLTAPNAPSQSDWRWNVHLPLAQLEFERAIHLGEQESVLYIEETVTNRKARDHNCDWVQHATFGPPFLNNDDTTFVVSAVRGLTSPTGYGPDSLLLNGMEFSWPFAPLHTASQGNTDLRRPFTVRGKGIVAAVLLDPHRELEFLLAVNWRLRIGVGYCFHRKDFPWMMVWEENCVRSNFPWNGTTLARGMEFGSTPFPAGQEDPPRHTSLFDTPSWCVIPGNGAKTTRYLMFLFKLPADVRAIENVEVREDSIDFHGENSQVVFSIPARGAEAFLSATGIPL